MDFNRVRQEDVRYAAKVWDKSNGYKNFKNSILHDFVIDGRACPPKAISVCAYERAIQIALTPYDLAVNRPAVICNTLPFRSV